MFHRRRMHTVCVPLVYSTIFNPYVWGGRVECRICKWKLLSFDRTFVAAFAQLSLFMDVGSSSSYIAQTN